jgi:hypothetical protein
MMWFPALEVKSIAFLYDFAVGNVHKGELDEMSPSGASIPLRSVCVPGYMKMLRNDNGVRQLRNTWANHSRSHISPSHLSSTSCCSSTVSSEQHRHQHPCSRRNTPDCWRNLRAVDARHWADLDDFLGLRLNGAALLRLHISHKGLF